MIFWLWPRNFDFARLLQTFALKIQRRGRQRERQKTIGLHFLAAFARLRHENAQFRALWGRKQATTKFYFSF